MSLQVAFWPHVSIGNPSDCWIWRGTKLNGYGVLTLNGKIKKAHRVAWELANGRDFPEGLEACHSCDVRDCMNPHHIWAGTHRENMRDAVKKGRLKPPPAELAGQYQRAKTHCPYGHEYTPENTVHRAIGRCCRACMRRRTNECGKRRRAARGIVRRIPRGAGHYLSRLTVAQAHDLRQRRLAGESVAAIAESFGLKLAYAYKVTSGITWHFRTLDTTDTGEKK